MKRVAVVTAAVALVAALLLGGCATMGLGGADPISTFLQLPPKGKATVAMDLYNKTYDDTDRVLKDPVATVEQKRVAVEKAKILNKYYPTVAFYKAVVDLNAPPTEEDEEKLIEFVNELIRKGVKL